MNPAVELRDVFRVHSSAEGDAAALQGLSLSVDEDEIVTVLGPSGAGKTTLLRIIAGLERPSAGAVRAFGFDLGRLPGRAVARYRASTIGYVDQHYTRALAPELPALELVGLKLRMAGVSARRAPRAVGRTPRESGPSGQGPRAAGCALRRRAAAYRRLRRARRSPASPARGRADG